MCRSVHVLQVRRVSGTMTLFWRSAHFGCMSCRAFQTECSCSPNVAIGVTIKELEECVCVCEQVVATALGVKIRGCQNTTVARTRLNPCFFFFWKCCTSSVAGEPCFPIARACAVGTHLVERDRKHIDYGSLALDISKTMIVPSDSVRSSLVSHLRWWFLPVKCLKCCVFGK